MGIISPKEIFEKQSDEIKEAFKRDWVDTIALLPFGEVIVLINAKKKKSFRSKVRFCNLTHPMLCNKPQHDLLSDDTYADILRLSDVKKKGYLRSLIIPNIPEQDGYEIVKFGDILRKMKRKTYSLERIPRESRVLVSIDRSQPYNMWFFDTGINKYKRSFLFAPAYHLKRDALLVNSSGNLEPRFYNAEMGSGFFEDGYAFEFKNEVENEVIEWLIEELNEQYVFHQLHPYGIDKMVPERVTEEQILNLKLYRVKKIATSSESTEEDPNDADKLPSGYELTGNNKSVYTIHKFLGHGNFGYAYTAASKNLVTGEEKEVVLKEFFPFHDFHREGENLKAVPNECSSLDIDVERYKFREEAKIMRKLGHIPKSHIVPSEEFFESDKTETLYYEMPFYHLGSLDDLQKKGTVFTEEQLLNNVVKPICKALHIAHNHKVLHLDINPEIILVADNGEAALTDFGVAKQYDEDGVIINRKGFNNHWCFAGPEMKTQTPMIKFGSEPDIFGLAATLYNLATNQYPYPIAYNSDDDMDLRQSMKENHFSDGFINAIIAGLQASATSRPRNAQAFLNLFPGCEEMKL